MPSRHPASEAASRGPDSARPEGSVTAWHYPGIAVQVALENADEVARALAQTIRGWQPRKLPALDRDTRTSSVLGTAGGFVSHSSYRNEAIQGLGVAGATCSVIADLAQDYFETRPGSLALHCAAFLFNDRLIAMTGPARAGKSTMAARLTMEADMQVFCDDVLPLEDDDNAVGLGVAPRLRLPLPDSCSDAFKAHVVQTLGPRDDRYGYICTPNGAPHGTRAPLSVLLILDRRQDAPAALHQVAEDEALHFLLSQNMTDLETAESAFVRLSRLLDKITCLRLVYSDLEEAVQLVRRAFGGSAPVAPDLQIGPPLPRAVRRALPQSARSPDLCWARNPEVVIQKKADSAFLWQPGKQTIWHMNMLGLAVWTLLEIPGSAREIGALLSEQFTDQDPEVLISDVNALLQALARDGLVEEVDSPA